jgi:hypothetical protein
LRSRLAETVEEAKRAQAALDRATAAHQRAVDLVSLRKQELVGFNGIETEITRQTIDALREGDGRAGLTDELREQVTLRERARMNFASSDAAEQHFADELAAARDKLAVRQKAVTTIVVQLLGIVAETFANEIHQCEDEIERRRRALQGFDQFVTPHGGHLPRTVFEILAAENNTRAADTDAWATAAAVLRRDPQAEVSVPLPEPKAPIDNTVVPLPQAPVVVFKKAVPLPEN